MWPLLSGRNLHCKLGAIQIRHHRVTVFMCMKITTLICCSCKYTHSTFIVTRYVFPGSLRGIPRLFFGCGTPEKFTRKAEHKLYEKSAYPTFYWEKKPTFITMLSNCNTGFVAFISCTCIQAAFTA